MEHLSELLSSIVPTFGVLGVGVLCRRLKIWDKRAVEVLNSYAYYIALPALIFQALYSTNIGASFGIDNLKLLGGVLLAHVVVFVFALIVAALFRSSKPVRAVAPMLLTFGSTAYLGLPYVTNTFGEQGAAIGSLISVMLVVALLFLSLIVLGRWGNSPDHTSTIKKLFELPFLYAVIVGLVIAFTKLQLPHFITKTVDIFAGSAGPISLLALGAFDYDFKLKNVNVPQAILFGAGKVFLTGAATFFMLKFFGITGLPLAVGTTMGAVSIAVTSFVLSEQYRVSQTLTDAALAVSSFCSFLALTAISWMWYSTSVFH
jgi:hypothetical protein